MPCPPADGPSEAAAADGVAAGACRVGGGAGQVWVQPDGDRSAEAAGRRAARALHARRALPAAAKAEYETRAAAEKAAVTKEAQAVAKRAVAGEGGYAKLRKEIAEFARKQPEAFVQLHERLVADENAVKARVLKQEEKAKEKVKKEAEAAFKARYPIADELLVDEPPLETPLPPAPDARYRLNLPLTLQPLSAELISLCDFVHTFGEALQISPISSTSSAPPSSTAGRRRSSSASSAPSSARCSSTAPPSTPTRRCRAPRTRSRGPRRAVGGAAGGGDGGRVGVAGDRSLRAVGAWRRRRRRRRRRRAARSRRASCGCCHSIRKWRS